MQVASRIAVWQSGKKLPYDAEVEYLESTGTQYIDTLIPSDSSYGDIEIGIKCLSTGFFFGGGPSETQGFGLRCLNLPSNGVVSYQIGWERSISFWNRTTYDPFDVVGLKVKENYRVYINGIGTNTYFLRQYSESAIIFGRRIGSAVIPSRQRIYFFRYGNLDLIPVRKGSVGYMYDRNSGKMFAAKGEGGFIIGDDKITPYDYEVEYISSNQSKAYFEIPVLPMGESGNNTDCEVEFIGQYPSGKAYQELLGTSKGSGNTNIMVTSIDGITFVAGWGLSLKKQALPTDRLNRVKISRSYRSTTVTINDEVVQTVEGLYGINTSYFVVFCRGEFPAYTLASNGFKFGGYKGRYANGVVHDIRTVSKGGRGCLYDAIGNVLYESVGELPAIPGPIKHY